MAVSLQGIVDAGEWLEEDSLSLLSGWARDGATFPEIADRMGISRNTLHKWRDKYPEIDKALKKGKERTNYGVENALLKKAMGYRTKEVKTVTVMRFGKVVEQRKEVTEKEVAPDTSAAQVWLYNCFSEKWIKDRSSMVELDDEESNIKVTVVRASKSDNKGIGVKHSTVEDQDGESWEDSDDTDDASDDEWEDAINEAVEIRSMTREEKSAARLESERAKVMRKEQEGD